MRISLVSMERVGRFLMLDWQSTKFGNYGDCHVWALFSFRSDVHSSARTELAPTDCQNE